MLKKVILVFALLLLIPATTAIIEQHDGFPVNAGATVKVLIPQDINGDGKLEIISAPENRMIKVFNYNGFPNWEGINGIVQSDDARVPVISDMSGDNGLEILSFGNTGSSDPTFYMWSSTGSKINEIHVGNKLLISSPVITNDGIILAGSSAKTTINQATGVHAFNTLGIKLWYLELGRSVNPLTSIPVNDINNDGLDEAVILTHDVNAYYPTDGKVWLIKAEQTQGSVLWSYDLGGDARNAAIADLNGDGINEIIVISSAGVYIFDIDGIRIYHLNIDSNFASPAIGDLDGDGINEIVIASSGNKQIHIIKNGMVTSFSIQERIVSNLALGDLNWDKKLEITAGDLNGDIFIWDYKGQVLEQLKVTKINDYFYTAKIADLEGDRNKEIIYGNYNGNIYVYTYPRETTPPVTVDNADTQWHNYVVEVILKAVDDESGVADTYYTIDGSDPTMNSSKGNLITFSTDGIFALKYFSIDNAGNIEQIREATIKIDRTQPLATDDSDNFWHNTDFTMNITALDNLSGVAYISYTKDGIKNISYSSSVQINFKEDGVHNLEYFSADNSGNIEAVKTATVRIDTAQPLILINQPQARTYLHSDVITLDFMVQDALSGIKTLNSSIDSNLQVSNGQQWKMMNLSLGSHEFRISTQDNAGNSINQNVSFNVIATIDSLRIITKYGSSNGWITSMDLANNLNDLVNSAKKKIDAGQNKAGKSLLIKFRDIVRQQKGRQITTEGANILEAEVEYVIGSLTLTTQLTGQALGGTVPNFNGFELTPSLLESPYINSNVEKPINNERVISESNQGLIGSKENIDNEISSSNENNIFDIFYKIIENIKNTIKKFID